MCRGGRAIGPVGPRTWKPPRTADLPDIQPHLHLGGASGRYAARIAARNSSQHGPVAGVCDAFAPHNNACLDAASRGWRRIEQALGLQPVAHVIVRALLIALALLAMAPGCEVDCFDGAALESSYRDGAAAARAANDAAYQQGRTQGLSLTREDGLADGDCDGYEDGYGAGYASTQGYSAGYADGYSSGGSDGSFDPSACSAGANDGYAAGDAAAYSEGHDAGYAEGWDPGYEDGYAEGASTCTSARVLAAPAPKREDAPDPDDLRECKSRGYDDATDPSAQLRGFSDGKRENPEYQAGYRAAYPAAFVQGEAIGVDDGYDDGYADGYANGYDDSYSVVYGACFAAAWSDGYEAGYDPGLESGYTEGYSAGYSSGYEAGADCD